MKSFRGLRTLLVAGAAILLVAGCGDDDDDNGNGGDANIRQGTWTVKSTTSILGSSAECQGIPPEVTTDDEVVCGDEDLTGGKDMEGLNCDIDVSDSTIDIDCELAIPVGPCVVTSVITGSGTYTETSYDITIDFTTSSSGSDPSCAEFGNACTTRTRVEGTWKNSEGDCTGKPGNLKRAVAGGIGLAFSRIR